MTTSPASLTVAARFHGPPNTGNGGYTCGRLASCLATAGPVTVTLWRPPPLDAALIVAYAPGQARLSSADGLVADAHAGAFDARAPDAVTVEQATAAEARYAGLGDHPFPGCFVCGTDRRPGDGMRLAPGRYVVGRSACVWAPDASMADADGSTEVAPEFVWAALDCPGGWASDVERRPLVLGRMTAVCERLPSIAEPYVVVGAVRGSERRKTFTSTALYDADQVLLARAEHTWIAVDPSHF
jgi:hypothetical protein